MKRSTLFLTSLAIFAALFGLTLVLPTPPEPKPVDGPSKAFERPSDKKSANAGAKTGRPVTAKPMQRGLLADFNNGQLPTGPTAYWGATSDDLSGGESTVVLTVTKAGSLHMQGVIRPGFKAPWAGAYASFSRDWQGLADLSTLKSLSFRAKGTPGTYRVMAFGADQYEPPSILDFTVEDDWTKITLSLDDFTGIELKTVRAFSIVAGPALQPFELEIDDVALEA